MSFDEPMAAQILCTHDNLWPLGEWRDFPDELGKLWRNLLPTTPPEPYHQATVNHQIGSGWRYPRSLKYVLFR